MVKSLQERFWSKVDKAGPDECWLWTGALLPQGYGSIGSVPVGDRVQSQMGAYRVSFFLTNGYWPKVTRHTCDNPPCVNPRHLIDGDAVSNARDMVERNRCPASQRTHCPQGHEYDDVNTWINRAGHRQCRECIRTHNREQAARKFTEDPAAFRAAAAARQRAYKARKRLASS